MTARTSVFDRMTKLLGSCAQNGNVLRMSVRVCVWRKQVDFTVRVLLSLSIARDRERGSDSRRYSGMWVRNGGMGKLPGARPLCDLMRGLTGSFVQPRLPERHAKPAMSSSARAP